MNTAHPIEDRSVSPCYYIPNLFMNSRQNCTIEDLTYAQTPHTMKHESNVMSANGKKQMPLLVFLTQSNMRHQLIINICQFPLHGTIYIIFYI